MNENIIIHLDSSNADSNEDLKSNTNYKGDYDQRLTYYLKNPIVLNTDYMLSVKSFVTNKRQNVSTIQYPEDTNSLATFGAYNNTFNQLGSIPYNQEVISETISNVTVYLFSTQSQTFYATGARITVKTVKNSGDANGLIEYISTDARGSDFDLNPCYIRKADITSPTTLYNSDNGQTYAIFSPINLNGGSEIRILSLQGGGNNTILSYATGVPITEGTFYNIPMYSPDGSGWYDYNGVRVTAKVVSTTGTNYGTVIIQEVTIGGSGWNLNDTLYLDKFSVVDGVYPNTYSASARFAPFNVSTLVNGLGELNPSNGISNIILPNSREYPFVDEVLTDVPFYEFVSGQYIKTDASGTVNIVKNAGNNQGTATLTTITDGGSGFHVPIELFLDKEDLIKNNNTYFSNRYIDFEGLTLQDDSGDKDLSILSGNYGYEVYGTILVPVGVYYYDVPNKNTRVFIEIINPSNATPSARIISISGGEGFAIGDTIELLKADVVRQDTGVRGWSKDNASGNLILEVISISQTIYNGIMYKFGLENIKYDNMKSKNSDMDGNPVILITGVKQNNINFNNPTLCLLPQVISEIKLLVKQKIQVNENIHVSLLLEKKNNVYV
tara:strand:+ start:3914 stop:5746 length:1833 start_codon:yes stop_codon:yes gene_type:complete